MQKKPLALMLGVIAALGFQAPLMAEEKPLNPAPVADVITDKPRLQDDFYTHINYDYLKNTKLTIDKAAMDNMSALNDKAEEAIQAIFSELNANYATLEDGSDAKRVIDFYNMALDFNTRDELGIKPVQATLDAIRAVKDLEAFNKLQETLFLSDYTPLLTFGVAQDQKDSSTNILYVAAPDIGLNKQHLEGKDDYSARVRTAYQTYLQDLLVLAGDDAAEAERKAKLVLDFETRLASAQLSVEEKQDHSRLYNEMTLADIEALIPNVAYVPTIRALGLDKAKKIVVQEPEALKKLNVLATDANLEAMKAHMELKVLRNHSAHLSKDFMAAVVKYAAVFLGMEHMDSDDKLAYAVTDSTLGELLGKIYVEKHFSPQTKADVIAMTDTIRDTYARRIGELDWLSEDTKKRAQKKLDTLILKIGYPDQWKDYSKLVIKPYADGGNLIDAINAAKRIDAERNIAQLNKAPDRGEWQMHPHTVNAYYNPLLNEIVFPAAILQAPYYSPDASRAENLGGIGAIIGHEISHAFDSSGAQFDENGNLDNWWQEADYGKFRDKVKQAADLYSAIEVAPGHHINGEISTGEIMADLGGLTVVLDIAEKEGIDQKAVMESFARAWRNVITRDAMIANLTDEHPPGKYRVNATVNQMEAFYREYGVKPEDKMYIAPEKRLHVW
ncbi:MAG: M13 family metallopeptidase [Cardiobacteriaceae bacterium]|nr:M13 family metallopeptidase [Cardiobacteriaceae bacterium]